LGIPLNGGVLHHQSIVRGNDVETVEHIAFLKDTVHFRKRKGDKRFEIIAKSEQEGFGWICIDVLGTHDDAIAAIKRWRA
jgi:hypothetical protein